MTALKENSYFCPFCGEQILKNARMCRFCQNSVTFDLYVFKIPGDTRRGEIAKKIFEITKTQFFPSFGSIRKSLENDTAALLTDITQEEAERITKILDGFDVGFELLVHENKPIGNFKKHMLIIGSSLVCLVAAFVYFSARIKPSTPPQIADASPTIPNDSSTQNQPTPIAATTSTQMSKETRMNIENMLISTATIKTKTGSGSAFFVSNDGHLISNEHVTQREKEVEVQTFNGKKFKGTVIKSQSFYDLSLIKIDSKEYPPLKLGDATMLHQGDTVWTIGAPNGLEFSVTRGIASYIGRNVGGKAFVQADVAINPGNSGGPMINDAGEVIGINNFIIRQTVGLNFAIPVNYLYSGSDPILKGVVDTVADSGKMATWRSWEQESDIVSRNEPQSENHSSPSYGSQSTTSDLSNLLKQLRETENTLQNARNKLDKEFESLEQKLGQLNASYANESTLSEQEKIGQQIRNLKIQQIDVQLKQVDAFLEYNKSASGLMIRAKQLSIGDETKVRHYDTELGKLVQSKSVSENDRNQLMKQRQALMN